MKFARIVALNSSETDLSVVDLFTTDAADIQTPMKIPAGADAIPWLEKMFEHQIGEWKKTQAHFRIVPEEAYAGARFTGDRANPMDVSDWTKYS